MSAKRFQWIAAFLTAVGGSVLLYAQNPVSISQVGTTPVTTTIPVSGTVTASGPLTDTQLRATPVPVSGTFWQATQPVSAAALPLPSGASTEATLSTLNGKVTAVNTGAVVISTFPDNEPFNIAQMNGVTVTMGNGASGTGVQRVTLADDSTGLVKLATGANTIGALSANQSVNVAQINGVTPLMGAGNTGTGSHRVTISTDQAALAGMGVGATAAVPPTNANYIAGITSGATGGLLSAGVTVCDSSGYLDMTTATTTEIAPLVSSRTIRVCQIVAMSNGTTVFTLKRGTGTNCGTGTASVSPAWDLTAQTGFSAGNGFGEILGAAGAGTVGGAMTSGNALCVTNSAAVNLHVMIRYAVY